MAEEIITSEYSEVMQKSYIDYAMSVICSRAVPDVRDGLKPVQRRVLYAMSQLGLRSDRPHRKSARIVGDTMGKYHPHGDSSIYETLVVMEQDFKKEMPLVDGHGNFGSIEGDGAAAMRYTEARLEKFTQDVYLADLDKDVVDFVPNFDETEREPSVLPVKIPNILVNGAEGIAVGMTTAIPTHNLSEIIDAEIAYMKKNSITTEELMEIVPGPDFPTGGIVTNKKDLLEIYETGVGKIKVRGRVEIERGRKKSDHIKLVITEIPYTMIGANIGKFILDVCDLAEQKKLPEIIDISNQSAKDETRIVIELKKDADPEKVINYLYKKTKLEDTLGVNMLAIADGKPEVLGLKSILKHCSDFQFEINTRKYNTLLAKALEQREIKEGLIKAVDIIDLIIEIIRGSKNISQAKGCLTSGITEGINFKSEASRRDASLLKFTELQAQAILDLRLAKLIGLEIEQLKKDYEDLVKKISTYEKILGSRSEMKKVIIKELEAIKKEYGFERKTEILDAAEIVLEEPKVEEAPFVFIMDRFGYCKLLEPAAYERNKEKVENENKFIINCLNTDSICVFTNTGVMHTLKVMKIPAKKVNEKGVPIDNLCNYSSEKEHITGVFALNDIKVSKLLFTTKLGMVKFVDGLEFDVSNRTVKATKLQADDEVISVDAFDIKKESITVAAESNDEAASDLDEDDQLTFDFIDIETGAAMQSGGMILTDLEEDDEPDEIIFHTNKMLVLQTRDGVFLRFKLNEVPVQKKNARGVKGINLAKDDEVENAYVVRSGAGQTIERHGKTIELMKIKLAKRGNKGTKLRN